MTGVFLPAVVEPAVERVSVKLIGPQAKLRAAFQSLDGDPKSAGRLTRIFFDTGDRRLWDQGYALSLDNNVEAAGARRLVLTRRTDLGLRRQVWTATSPDAAPNPKLLPKEAPTGPFKGFRGDELLPRFRLSVQRAVVVADMPGARVSARLDAGAIAAIGGKATYRALDVRLEGGGVDTFLADVGALAGAHGLALSLQDPTRLGMTVAAGETSGRRGVKSGWPVFTPEIVCATAVRRIIATSAAHAFANLEAAAGGETPGGVHQLRVALRRLRAGVTLFKRQLGPAGVQLNAGARAALQRLGPARDLDVFLTETAPPVAAACDVSMDALMARATAAHARAYGDVRAMMRDPAFIAFQSDLLVAAETDALDVEDGDAALRPMASKLLQRRHKKLLRVGAGFAALPNAQRHDARIELKKLRYAAGYFRSLFPGAETDAYRSRMSALQDELGVLNDADVASALVDRLAGHSKPAALAGAAIKGWQGHRLAANEARMIASWDAFAGAQPFWKD